MGSEFEFFWAVDVFLEFWKLIKTIAVIVRAASLEGVGFFLAFLEVGVFKELFNTEYNSDKVKIHKFLDCFLEVRKHQILVFSKTHLFCLLKQFSVFVELRVSQILSPADHLGRCESFVHHLCILEPDEVWNCNKLSRHLGDELFGDFVQEFFHLLFKSQIDFEFWFFIFFNVTVVRIDHFFTWRE